MTLAERIQARIDAIDAEILRVQAQAVAQVNELKADKVTFQQALSVLTKAPEIEQLLPALQKLGAI
jgi:hypothetical protein